MPAVERLDTRAVHLRQAAVVKGLTVAEREALAAVVGGLGVVGPWRRIKPVHDVFVLLAGQRAVERLTSHGVSRTAALREAAAELGVAYTTLRDAVNGLVLQKGSP